MRADRYICALALVTLASAREASAADIFTLLDWACNKDDEAKKGVGDREALSTCSMTASADKKACDVVTGEPFHCFEPQLYRGFETCEYNDIEITIKASTQQTLGWKIEGVVYVTLGYKVDFEGDECRPSIRPVLDDTGTGTFVRRAGIAKLHSEFTASGEGYITFLGGKIFGKKYTATCTGDASPKGYITDTKSGCKANCPKQRRAGSLDADQCMPEPTPSPGPSPDPTPPDPSPSPDPSPLPDPTPDPTPPADPTPNPTPIQTPNPTPFPNPTALASRARA